MESVSSYKALADQLRHLQRKGALTDSDKILHNQIVAKLKKIESGEFIRTVSGDNIMTKN